MTKRRLKTALNTLFFSCAVLCTPNAIASFIVEAEPNDSASTAQDVSAFFDLAFSDNIGDQTGANTSVSIPHVTIQGTGDGTFDWYSFTTSAPGTVILDIDFGFGANAATSTDTVLSLWSSTGTLLASNDDSPISAGAGGSASLRDSFIDTSLTPPGRYFASVCEFGCKPGVGGFVLSGPGVNSGTEYRLQISANAGIPEPVTLTLIVTALAGLSLRRRMR